MPVVGVEVAAGGLDGRVAEDVLEDVQRDAGVGEPGRAGVPEAVPSEVGEAEITDDLVPVGRVPHGRGRESAALRADQQPVLGLLAFRETMPAEGSCVGILDARRANPQGKTSVIGPPVTPGSRTSTGL